jgi:hypothetical protein
MPGAKIKVPTTARTCCAAATDALDVDTSTPRGLTRMTGQQIASPYVGNTCRMMASDEIGNATSTGANLYRTDGTVTKTSTRSGGDPVTRERTWRMSRGNFRETLFGSVAGWCGGHEIFWQRGGTMYSVHDHGAVPLDINSG